MSKILLVDDDPQSRDSTRKILELAQHEVVTAVDGQVALEIVRGQIFDLILTDVRMPKLGGLEFLRAISLVENSTPVILMTAYGRVEDAVWAMKLGAVDFLTKPFKRQTLLTALELALKRGRRKKSTLSSQAQQTAGMSLVLGNSISIQELRKMITQVAPTPATVLLTGESGTGKELVAQCIHQESSRKNQRFIALNCAALPENLIESELFGYVKGAFTGATNSREGLFEAADGGTLLLDEIGDMPLSLQAKLLRTLQENEVRRVGSTESKKINVRVIAATHQNLKEAVQVGKFREDLLYRLEVVHLMIPPLRDRPEDILELTYHFLKQASERHSKKATGISDACIEILLGHAWPGNARELSNVIERAVIFAQTSVIEARDLPSHLVAGPNRIKHPERTISIPLGTSLKDVEELLIRKTLEATSGDKNMTAKLLGINSRTIYRKLDKKIEIQSDNQDNE